MNHRRHHHHHYPAQNPLFSHHPINPNPNFPNPQFNFLPPPPPPQQPPPPPPPPPQSQNPPPDLSNSLSSLKALIQSSTSTLHSLSSLFPSLSLSSSRSLTQCPSNPHHWVPSSSLFLHSLTCPSPIDAGFDTLQYPKTLDFDHNVIEHSKFVQLVNDHSSELCLCIDDYVDSDSNFFYKDCPGVVNSSKNDASDRIFTLPGVISVECANLVGCGGGFAGCSVKVLPSEVWSVSREVDDWGDYPTEYSFIVVRAILCVECVKECDLAMWVIENSPQFGVVLDVAMRDHVCVLFRLCLKAIVREAARSYGSMVKSHVDDESRVLNPRCLRFKCPAFVEVLSWLTSHIGILYGETNAKALVIAMLRHLFSDAASHSSMFPIARNSNLSCDSEQTADVSVSQPSGKVTVNVWKDSRDVGIFSRPIFLYQIAASIAALQERSLLEGKIRTLRNPPQLTAYQRSAEHSYFSNKAYEERQKRPNYRPIIDHDGLFNQRQNDQGNNRPKTREELLAEERDYKRRRMSYRGKKLKRSAKEVMRDIIEDYMEAIKHIGGIGGPAKEDSEGAALTSALSVGSAGTSSKLKNTSRNNVQDDYKASLDADFNSRDTEPPQTARNHERQEKDSFRIGHREDGRTTNRDRQTKDYSSRSPSRDRRHGRSSEHRSYSRNRASETSEDKHSRSSHSSFKRSRNHGHKEAKSTSRSLRSSSDRKVKRESESPDRQNWQRHKYGKADPFERVEIADRYDPLEASDDCYD